MSLHLTQPQSDLHSAQTTIVGLVDPDADSRARGRTMLESAGYRVVEYADGQSAIRGNGKVPSVFCIDLDLPDVRGQEVVQQLNARDPEASLLVVGAAHGSEAVSAALVAGAYDVVQKPWDEEVLLHSVRRAVERRTLVCGIRRLETELREHSATSTLVGDSPAMRELARQLVRAAESDIAVCVLGERGTGKELVARAIHATSRRRCGPLVVASCAAIAADRHEVELFGQEAAAGPRSYRMGRVTEARGGVLYLDEVQALSPDAQAGLLRLIRNNVTRPVGSDSDRVADVRIVCGSSVDLSAEVETGRLDPELHAAISQDVIQVAPLRQRREDIPVLVGHYLSSRGTKRSSEPPRVSPDVVDALTRHPWPGNVRELQDVVVRSLLASRGDEITLADLPADIRRLAPGATAPTDAADDGPKSSSRVIPLRELERRAIESALKATRGSVGKAAKLLGIGRATLYRRLASLELQRRPDSEES